MHVKQSNACSICHRPQNMKTHKKPTQTSGFSFPSARHISFSSWFSAFISQSCSVMSNMLQQKRFISSRKHTHTIADWVSPELILSGRSVIKWGRGGKKNMIFPLTISDAVIREQTWCQGILPSWKSPSTRWSYTWICPAIVAELEFYSFKDIYIVAPTHANVPALEMINTCCYVVEWF